MAKDGQARPDTIEPIDESTGDLNVIVETPKGSRNKFKFDEKLRLYKLSGVLPAGMGFPYDFGFIPSTRGEDGDPIDVLLLMDEPAFPGCLVASRLIGVIEVEQTEEGKTVRNDRLLAVAVESVLHRDVVSISQLSTSLLDEIEAFFDAYTRLRGKRFRPLARSGPETAMALVRRAMASPAAASRKENQGMNAIELLETDHKKVRKLLEELDQTTERGVKTRSELLGKLRTEMVVHETIEEEIFYPALEEHPKAEEIVKEGYQEHHVADLILAELASLEPGDEDWGAKASVLKENIEHHIEEEEGQMFPLARKILGETELEELGSEMEDRKADALAEMIK